MRSLLTAITMLLGMALGQSASAQTPGPAVALPKTPIPYSQVRPKARPPAPRTATPPTAPAAEAAHPAQGSPPVTGQALPPAELEAFVDGWIEDAMRREHLAGVTLSIVQNGQVVLKKGYGFADLNTRRRVDPDRTLFRIGSISKTFTWILLMREVEAGRIRLNAPINRYLPAKVRVRAEGQSRDVLVANLMDHSAGFENRALGQLFERDPRRVRPLDLYLRQERPRRVRAPGVTSSYSNYGAALAGEAVAHVSGKTFERRVEDEITGPLGMTHTTFREPRAPRRGLPAPMPEALRADIARGYGWRDARFTPFAYEYIGQIGPAGSGSSTAGDMSRYMLMLLGDGTLNGATVFGPAAARAFRTPLRPSEPGINGWAHGFMTTDLPGGHRGYGHLGSTLSFHSNMTLVPALGLGVFVSVNSERGERLTERLPSAIVRQFGAPPSDFPRPGSRALAAGADAYGGFYRSTRRAYGGLEGFVDLLNGGAWVEVTPGGRLITRRAVEAQAWVPEGPLAAGRFIATLGEERLVFRDAGGADSSFRESSGTERMERAPPWQRPDVLAGLAGLTVFASLMALAGLALRNRREMRQNQIQARAALMQNIQGGLWLAALGLFAAWANGASDIEAVVYGWPGPLLVTASACALVAAALTLATIAALPSVWQGGRRVDSWPLLRKLFFTLTVLIYAAFSIVLGINGALQPWAG